MKQLQQLSMSNVTMKAMRTETHHLAAFPNA